MTCSLPKAAFPCPDTSLSHPWIKFDPATVAYLAYFSILRGDILINGVFCI